MWGVCSWNKRHERHNLICHCPLRCFYSSPKVSVDKCSSRRYGRAQSRRRVYFFLPISISCYLFLRKKNFFFALWGVEGTSVMLLSSRSVSRSGRMEGRGEGGDEEEEEEVEARHHGNGRHVHLWTGRRDDDSGCTTSPGSDVFQPEEEEEEEVEEQVVVEEEKVALPAAAALSGHGAPTVDETAAVVPTLAALQWTIEWTPRVDVPTHSPSSTVSFLLFLPPALWAKLGTPAGRSRKM